MNRVSRLKRSSRDSNSEPGFQVVISRRVEGYLETLKEWAPKQAERCADALQELAKNPYRPRPGVDIKRIHGQPYQYRLRVRRNRFGYDVDKKTRVVDVKIAAFK